MEGWSASRAVCWRTWRAAAVTATAALSHEVWVWMRHGAGADKGLCGCRLAHLRLDQVEEGAIARVQGAGKDELLPHHQAKLRRETVEALRLVTAATPHPDHVHVGANRLFEEPASQTDNTQG